MTRQLTFLLAVTLGVAAATKSHAGWQPIGTHLTGVFDDSAAEIPAFDPLTDRLFVVNATQGVDVLDLSNPFTPSLLFQIPAPGVNSVAVNNGRLAVAVENADKQLSGTVSFFPTNLTSGSPAASTVDVGALPDMVTFTPDGSRVLVANEGEPSDDYTVDPIGSVSVIDLPMNLASLTQGDVTTVGFGSVPVDPEVRVFGPNASVAQDLEPEYIAVDPSGDRAYVALQENNGLAVLDLNTNTFTEVRSLGFKDHSLPGAGLDANKNDDAAVIENLPIFGVFQPDAIAAYSVGGQTYIVTANEGDGRDYDTFTDEADLSDLPLDPTAFSPEFIARAGDGDDIGDLNVLNNLGDVDNDGLFEEVYAFGGRSFSIFDDAGNLVFDSGDDFEQITAAIPGLDFNATNDESGVDDRSDNKGPEPEAVTIGEIDGVPHAFIGLERVGGVMVYDISDPTAPLFVEYFNNRDFDADPTTAAAGDLGPEGIVFVSADDSPIGVDLLIVANEVSGTTTIFAQVPEPAAGLLAALAAAAGCLARRNA